MMCLNRNLVGARSDQDIRDSYAADLYCNEHLSWADSGGLSFESEFASGPNDDLFSYSLAEANADKVGLFGNGEFFCSDVG